jgi:hypothetical protein
LPKIVHVLRALFGVGTIWANRSARSTFSVV